MAVPRTLPDLTKPELAIMKLFWAAGPLSAREVHERRQSTTDWAYSTTRTDITYRKLVRMARPVRDHKLLSRLRWWRARFKIRRRVRLVTSEASLLPFTLGTLRPVIYLPETILRGAEPTVADAFIAHEMAHIKRWDDLWLRFQNLIQLLYFKW